MEPRPSATSLPRPSRRGGFRGGRAAILLVLATVMSSVLWVPSSPVPPPPRVSLTGNEAVDLIDDRGIALQLVTFRIANTNPPNPSHDPRLGLYVVTTQDDLLVEDSKGNWRPPGIVLPREALSRHDPIGIGPGQYWEASLLAPETALRVRIRSKYAGPSAALLWRHRMLRWLDEMLPRTVRGTILQRILNAVGPPGVLHREPWNEHTWESPLLPVSSNTAGTTP